MSEYRDAVKKILWEKVGVIRDGKDLSRAVDELQKLKETPQKMVCHDKPYNRELINAIENNNMVNIALTIALSALERKETRGAHIRSDYPETDNENYMKNIFVHAVGSGYRVSAEPVDLKYCKPE